MLLKQTKETYYVSFDGIALASLLIAMPPKIETINQ